MPTIAEVYKFSWRAVGNVDYRVSGKSIAFSSVCFGKVKGDPFSDQLVTFARRLYETLPIKYSDLLSAALYQTCTFQLFRSIRDRWPLDTQHFCQKVMGDRHCVVVTAITHHK